VRELSINNRILSRSSHWHGSHKRSDDLVFTGTNNPDTQVVNRTLISVHGARTTQNTFTVDGADVTDRGSNLTIQAYPSVDSIGEFQVLRSLFPAETGRSGGGQINVITRSGGDQFHGNAFEFIRNEAFNANDFILIAPHQLVVPATDEPSENHFAITTTALLLAGPFIFPTLAKDRERWFQNRHQTFFFFSEEQRRDTRYPNPFHRQQ